jgi:phosphomannomutase
MRTRRIPALRLAGLLLQLPTPGLAFAQGPAHEHGGVVITDQSNPDED